MKEHYDLQHPTLTLEQLFKIIPMIIFPETAYKTPEDAAGLPTIPVQPIGYGDAKMILE